MPGGCWLVPFVPEAVLETGQQQVGWFVLTVTQVMPSHATPSYHRTSRPTSHWIVRSLCGMGGSFLRTASLLKGWCLVAVALLGRATNRQSLSHLDVAATGHKHYASVWCAAQPLRVCTPVKGVRVVDQLVLPAACRHATRVAGHTKATANKHSGREVRHKQSLH